MLDQTADKRSECYVEEAVIEGVGPLFLYTLKTLADDKAKPCLVSYHGGGFISSGPQDWKKECSGMAVTTGCMVVCPFIGTGPDFGRQ